MLYGLTWMKRIFVDINCLPDVCSAVLQILTRLSGLINWEAWHQYDTVWSVNKNFTITGLTLCKFSAPNLVYVSYLLVFSCYHRTKIQIILHLNPCFYFWTLHLYVFWVRVRPRWPQELQPVKLKCPIGTKTVSYWSLPLMKKYLV